MRKSIDITIDGVSFVAPFKKFKSSRVGYGLYSKQEIDNDTYQIVCNIIKVKESTGMWKKSRDGARKVKLDKFVERI